MNDCETCENDDDNPICEGCSCCQECCNCTDTDCDCDACLDRRDLIGEDQALYENDNDKV